MDFRAWKNRVSGCKYCEQKSNCHAPLEPGAFPLFTNYDPRPGDPLCVLEAPNRDDTFDPRLGYLSVGDGTDPSASFLGELMMSTFGRFLPTTNSVLCLPKGVRENGGKITYPVTRQHTSNCRQHLRSLVDALHPPVIVAVGGKALRSLGSPKPIGKSIGVPFESAAFGRPVYPVAHVSRLGRANRHADIQRQDWAALKRFVDQL